MSIEKITFHDIENCYRVSNGKVEVVVTTEFGPRIVFYGRPGGENQMGLFLESAVNTEWGPWKPYGGHRLWVAPESIPFSYAPDNDPIEAKVEGELSLRLVQKTDAAEIDKEISLHLYPESTTLELRHKIVNRALATREVAIWALTVFKGGEAFVPLAPYRSHDDALAPSQAMILWPFTNLADPRIQLGDGWMRMKSDESLASPQKLGLANRKAWAARLSGQELFVKRFNYREGANYPDFGCNCEFYVAADYMELETLSPLTRLQTGDSMEHTETWELHSVADRDVQEVLAVLDRLP